MAGSNVLTDIINWNINWFIENTDIPITVGNQPIPYSTEYHWDRGIIGVMNFTDKWPDAVNAIKTTQFNEFEKLSLDQQKAVYDMLKHLYGKATPEATMAADIIAVGMKCPYYQQVEMDNLLNNIGNSIANGIDNPFDWLNRYDALHLNRFGGLTTYLTEKERRANTERSFQNPEEAAQYLSAQEKARQKLPLYSAGSPSVDISGSVNNSTIHRELTERLRHYKQAGLPFSCSADKDMGAKNVYDRALQKNVLRSMTAPEFSSLDSNKQAEVTDLLVQLNEEGGVGIVTADYLASLMKVPGFEDVSHQTIVDRIDNPMKDGIKRYYDALDRSRYNTFFAQRADEEASHTIEDEKNKVAEEEAIRKATEEATRKATEEEAARKAAEEEAARKAAAEAAARKAAEEEAARKAAAIKPRTVHKYAEEDYTHATQRIEAYIKRGVISKADAEKALANIQQMEKDGKIPSGLSADGKSIRSNAPIYLYKALQSEMLYHPDEPVYAVKDNKITQKKEGSVSEKLGGSNRDLIKGLASKEASKYADRVMKTEDAVSEKGHAVLGVKVKQPKLSFKPGRKPGYEAAQIYVDEKGNIVPKSAKDSAKSATSHKPEQPSHISTPKELKTGEQRGVELTVNSPQNTTPLFGTTFDATMPTETVYSSTLFGTNGLDMTQPTINTTLRQNSAPVESQTPSSQKPNISKER